LLQLPHDRRASVGEIEDRSDPEPPVSLAVRRGRLPVGEEPQVVLRAEFLIVGLVDEMLDRILGEMAPARGDRVALLVNGLGATPLMELYIMNRRVRQRLDDAGVAVHATWVGNWCTSLEMAGASVTCMNLDGELTALLDHPCDCAMFRVGTVDRA